MKNVYFLSDAHLGSRAIEHGRTQERRLVNFLDSIKHKAAAIYCWEICLTSGMSLNWLFQRIYSFFGKALGIDRYGVEVHFFTGNHDIWCGDYLTKECGAIIHRKPLTTEIYGKEFYLAHGDGLGDPDKKFKFLRAMFHNETLQFLFSMIHPRWSIDLGLTWAKHSRMKREDGKEPDYMGEDKEHLVLYTKEYLKSHPNINYFIYGHRHIELDLMLSATARILILGDWINYFSYAVFDGENLFLENYIEGETQL